MTWYKIVTRKNVDLLMISYFVKLIYDEIIEFNPNNKTPWITHFENNTFSHYTSNNFFDFGMFLMNKYFGSSEKIMKYVDDAKNLIKEDIEDVKRFKELLEENNLENLNKAFRKFHEWMMRIIPVYDMMSFLAFKVWQENFNKIMPKNLDENIISSIFRPIRKTVFTKIYERLKNGEDPKKLLEEFQYLRSWSFICNQSLTIDWIKSLYTNKVNKKYLSEEEIIKLLNPTDEQIKIIKIAPYISYFKDWRDEFRRKITYSWSFIFDKISEFYNVDIEKLKIFTYEDFFRLLKSSKFIEVKENNIILIPIKNGFEKKKYDYYYEKLLSGEKIIGNEVKGIIACKGNVKGKVKIVNSISDLELKNNEIFVSVSTHLEYLPGMKKALAIITDEGGITSHAAIVSRELGIPCVVGTKYATKILKNGDLVGVDANNGVVRKIE